MKISLESDLHIEMGPNIGYGAASDVHVCAGDIGCLNDLPRMKKYFDSVRKHSEHIIYVMGNHEFYHSDYVEGLEIAAEFAEKEGIHLLDEALGTDNLEIDGIKFWGSTLWTDLNGEDWFAKQKVGTSLNDFYVISQNRGKRTFSAADTLEINKRTREKINWDADVVITHHCPIMLKHKRFPISDITYGFCNTGLENLILDSNIKYWLSGHTHDSVYKDLNGTKLVSNQQGYPRHSWQDNTTIYEESGFDPGLILQI